MRDSETWKEIDPSEFVCRPFRAWKEDWFALAAGEFPGGPCNAMTVGWGFFGCMWAEPAVTVFLRPQRYTLEILERYDTFTLSAFGPEYREALTLLGRVSGRENPDKLARAGLTPVPSVRVEAPSSRKRNLCWSAANSIARNSPGADFSTRASSADTIPSATTMSAWSGRSCGSRAMKNM